MGRRNNQLVALSGWIVSAFFLLYIVYHAGERAPSLDIYTSAPRSEDIYAPSLSERPSPGSASAENPLTYLVTVPEAPKEVVVAPKEDEKKDHSLFGPWSSIESLFLFGDSYTSSNFYVHGELPSVENPMGNNEFAGASNLSRLTWPNFLTRDHNESHVLAYNLAVGGSVVDKTIAKPYMFGIDFPTEVNVFLEHWGPDSAAPKTQWHPETSLFFAWFGINDLMLEWWREDPQPPDLVAEFKTYANATRTLYNAGARKFVFLTVPPAYRSVDFEFDTLLTMAEDMAEFNARLVEMRSALETDLPDATIAIFDAHSFWARVIANPHEFEETKDVVFATGYCTEITDDEDEDGKPIKNISKPEEWREWEACYDGAPMMAHIWTEMHGAPAIHNATAARVVRDCLGPQGRKGFCS